MMKRTETYQRKEGERTFIQPPAKRLLPPLNISHLPLYFKCVVPSVLDRIRCGLGGEPQLMRHLVENVPVQGPEICFPKHASCDFSQHCRAQQQAFCFLEISCEKRDKPREPLSLLILTRFFFFFFFF